MRVGDRGGFKRCLRQAGRLGGLMPEAGVGEEACSALRVMDDRDFEEPVSRALAAEQLSNRPGGVRDTAQSVTS